MNETQVKEVLDGVTAAIAKEVPEIVESKVAEAMAKQASDIEAIKTELKAAQVSAKSTPEVKAAFAKTAVVSIMKEVMATGATSEKAFDSIVNATMKTMTEGTATDGAELVFDQFEQDILRVINSYDLLSNVKLLNIAKGDKVSLPKATNGVTTAFVDEGATYGSSTEADTSFITIDIKKAATLTDMTEELLDDTMTVPDLYDLIVEFIGESQAAFLEGKIINGTAGVVGILQTSGTGAVALGATETAEDIADSDLVAMVTAVPRKFKRAGNTGWLMSQYTYGKLMALKTTDGYPLYPELRDFNAPKLMGYKVILSEEMPVQDAGDDVALAKQIVFGNYNYFTVARRKGVTLEQGYYGDNWKKDIKSLKSNSRYGGKVTFAEAFAVLSNGAAS